MSRLSYQDHLAEGTTADPFPCEGCGRITPAWGLYMGDEALGEPSGWICGECIACARHAAEIAALPAPPAPNDWASDRGVYLKAERVMKLDKWRWTVAPDSPLSADCQAAFLAFLMTLNRMTIDSTPDVWEWPEPPALEYAQAS